MMNDQELGAYLNALCERTLLGTKQLLAIVQLFAYAGVRGYSPQEFMMVAPDFVGLYKRIQAGLNDIDIIMADIEAMRLRKIEEAIEHKPNGD